MSSNASTWETNEKSKSQEVKEQGKQVAGHAKEEASSVAEKVRDEAGAVAQVAEEQARGLFHDVQQQMRDQGEQQVSRLSEVLHGLSKNLQALQEGRAEDAGALADYVERARKQVDDAAQRMDDLGLSGVLDEGRRFARRRPGAFLGGAAVAGLVVGRLVRAGKDAQSNTSGSYPSGQSAPTPGGRTAGTVPATPPAPIEPTPVATDVVVVEEEIDVVDSDVDGTGVMGTENSR